LEEGISVQQAEQCSTPVSKQSQQQQQQQSIPSSAPIASPTVTFRLLPNPTRHGPPSHV
jgi:hypothetical protein